MIGSLNDLAKNGRTLQDQIAQLIDLQSQQLTALQAISLPRPDATAQPEDQIIPIWLASTGTTSWQDPRQLIVVRAVASTDTAGLFSLAIGQNDTHRKFRLATNTPFEIINPSARIVIPKGMAITLTPGTGNPAWELALFCVAGTVEGAVDARQ